jgi:predicted O-linked N-acetylglucosamine transferase (SPINDLY family)
MNNHILYLLQLAQNKLEIEDYQQAKLFASSVLKLNPKNFDALHIYGVILCIENNFIKATVYLRKALKENPNNYWVNFNLAKALMESGYELEAIKYHSSAIALAPNYPEAWLNFGKCLHQLKLYSEALEKYDRAIQLNSSYSEAWNNKGIVLYDLHCYDEALNHYNKAIQLRSDFYEAWLNKGNALNALSRFDEGIEHYDVAIKLKPDDPSAWSFKGITLTKLNLYDLAIAHYDEAIQNDINYVFSDMLNLKMKACFWDGLDKSIQSCLDQIYLDDIAIPPFSMLALVDDPEIHQKFASSYFLKKSKFKFNSPHLNPKKSSKIKIAFFSSDFRDHPVSHLISQFLELINKDFFEIHGFAYGSDTNDQIRQRIINSCNEFHYIDMLSNAEIVSLAKDKSIDIAIDLNGFTHNARTEIFIERCAPIQVNFLGYPGTIGGDSHDYIIADKILIPQEFQHFYNEKIIYLPNCYQPNDFTKKIAKLDTSRSDYGLPDNGFVFCCFNNTFKILPDIFQLWMDILKEVENSVLWLLVDNPTISQNLKIEALKHGVLQNRLVFAERAPLEIHLARHQYANLFLDTFPYNAHTTASDALWADLPVLTYSGKSFPSRVAASLLNSLGLNELITYSPEEYKYTAIDLALNPDKLSLIKNKLISNKTSFPLFDTSSYTRHFEIALQNIYSNFLSGSPPRNFEIL